MKKSLKEVDKSLRNEIMKEISLKYRENQKTELHSQKVNIFQIWLNHDMTYSEFLDVILSLEAQEYLHYHRADKNAKRYNVKGECVPQEFVTLERGGKSFPEDLSDEKEKDKKLNIKYPVVSSFLTTMIGYVPKILSKDLLSRIKEWILSLFRS